MVTEYTDRDVSTRELLYQAYDSVGRAVRALGMGVSDDECGRLYLDRVCEARALNALAEARETLIVGMRAHDGSGEPSQRPTVDRARVGHWWREVFARGMQ